jgi:hypothetical protein
VRARSSTAASAPVAEGASAQDVFNALDADGDGLVTEAELRAAAEARGIQLTEEQVAAFLAADADGDGVDVNEYLNSVDWTVLGVDIQCQKWGLFGEDLCYDRDEALKIPPPPPFRCEFDPPHCGDYYY